MAEAAVLEYGTNTNEASPQTDESCYACFI